MLKELMLLIVSIFVLGWIAGALYTTEAVPVVSQPKPEVVPLASQPFFDLPVERLSPKDRIKESDIEVLPDKVVIKLKNPQWSKYLDTNSMDPLLDTGANGIQIVPQKPEDIEVGDVISYDSGDGIIIHRVIEIGNDEQGWYARTKGDNLKYPDFDKVRFSQVKRVLVAVIY